MALRSQVGSWGWLLGLVLVAALFHWVVSPWSARRTLAAGIQTRDYELVVDVLDRMRASRIGRDFLDEQILMMLSQSASTRRCEALARQLGLLMLSNVRDSARVVELQLLSSSADVLVSAIARLSEHPSISGPAAVALAYQSLRGEPLRVRGVARMLLEEKAPRLAALTDWLFGAAR